MRLVAIESWGDTAIVGMIEKEEKYLTFVSAKGKIPDLRSGNAFDKNDYKGYDHFCGVISKFMPEFTVAVPPIEIKSVRYEDLLDICKEKFPLLEDNEPLDEVEMPQEEEPEKSSQIPIPEEDIDEDYS
jgi:hypothetical protein